MDRETSGLFFSYYKDKEGEQNNRGTQATYTERQSSPRKQEIPKTEKPISFNKQILDDFVTQDKIWKETVVKEKEKLKQWDENWRFMVDGELDDDEEESVHEGDITDNEEELPENGLPIRKDIPVFSQFAPNTNSQNYGYGLRFTAGQSLVNMQFHLTENNRKKKLDSEMNHTYY